MSELGSTPGSSEAVTSPIVPRPRPGYRSRPEGVPTRTKAALVAAVMRALIGVVSLATAVLYLPVHMVTPILSGVSVVMIVTGTYSVWRVGVAEPRLRQPTRVLAWVMPALTVLVFVVMAVLGAGSLGPDWGALGGAPEGDGTVRFESAP